MANARNEPIAAPHGEPSSSGSRPSSSRTRVSSAVCGSRNMRAAIRVGLRSREALGHVQGGQLALLLVGHRLELGALELDLALEQLALALHRDVLARGHRERAREQARDPGQQDEVRLARGARDAHHQRQVGHQAVRDAEDDRPQRPGAGAPVPALGAGDRVRGPRPGRRRPTGAPTRSRGRPRRRAARRAPGRCRWPRSSSRCQISACSRSSAAIASMSGLSPWAS